MAAAKAHFVRIGGAATRRSERWVQIHWFDAAFNDRFRDLRRDAEPHLLQLRAPPLSCCSCIGWPPNDRKVRDPVV